MASAATEGEQPVVLVLPGADPVWTWICQQLDHGMRLRPVITPSAVDALRAIACERPAVVLLCPDPIIRHGSEFLDRLRTASASACFVFVASATQIGCLRQSVRGASYLEAGELTRDRLRAGLYAAAAGLRVSTTGSPASGAAISLTQHEREVLEGLRRNLTEEQMGKEFHISRATVTRALHNLELKLRAHGRFMLGARAAWLGIVQSEGGDQEV